MKQESNRAAGQSPLIPTWEEIEEALRPLTGTARIKAAQTVIDFTNLLDAAAQELLSDRLDPMTTQRILSRLGQMADTQAGETEGMADLWRGVQAGISTLANAPDTPGAANFELHRAKRVWINHRSLVGRMQNHPLRPQNDPQPKGPKS
jgi:hypothetical protein